MCLIGAVPAFGMIKYSSDFTSVSVLIASNAKCIVGSKEESAGVAAAALESVQRMNGGSSMASSDKRSGFNMTNSSPQMMRKSQTPLAPTLELGPFNSGPSRGRTELGATSGTDASTGWQARHALTERQQEERGTHVKGEPTSDGYK